MTGNKSFHEGSPLYDEPNETNELLSEVKWLKNLNALLFCKTVSAFRGACREFDYLSIFGSKQFP